MDVDDNNLVMTIDRNFRPVREVDLSVVAALLMPYRPAIR
jgi:hypothetical protein